MKNRVLTMLMNVPHRYILYCFAILSLSACESASQKESIVIAGAGSQQSQVKASSEGGVTPLPVPMVDKNMASIDSSVEIFDMELNPAYNRGVSQSTQQPQMQSAQMSPMLTYGEEFGTSDSSVTVYGFDDVPPNMGVQPYGVNPNYAQAYSQSYGQVQGHAAGQIFFKHGSSRLGTGDMKKISALAEQAKFAPVNHITVEGFASKPTQVGTDTTQAHILNLRQSLKRAEKVSRALMRKGVPGEKMKMVSWGAAKATGNESYDRRVDVVMGER